MILQQILEFITDLSQPSNEDNNDITFVPSSNEMKIRSTRGSESTSQSSNISMNIDRNNDQINLQGGSQLHPSMNSRVNRLHQRAQAQANAQARARSGHYPNVRNTYQPQRGPGGRAEAPREQVVMGSQALQYAATIANRMRQHSSQTTNSNVNSNVNANVNVPGRIMTYGSGNRLGGRNPTSSVSANNQVSTNNIQAPISAPIRASVSLGATRSSVVTSSNNSNIAATAA